MLVRIWYMVTPATLKGVVPYNKIWMKGGISQGLVTPTTLKGDIPYINMKYSCAIFHECVLCHYLYVLLN